MNLNINATLTGGTTAAYLPAGLSAGNKVSFTAPSHTRLAPRTLDILVQQPSPQKNGDPGVARTAFKVAFANVLAEEGCCGSKAGTIIFDGGIRWPLSQPESVVDEVIAAVRAFVYTSQFVDACKKGVLPTA